MSRRPAGGDRRWPDELEVEPASSDEPNLPDRLASAWDSTFEFWPPPPSPLPLFPSVSLSLSLSHGSK